MRTLPLTVGTIHFCGIGGIGTSEDAVKFLLCGASAVQVGTANYLNPMASEEIARGVQAYAARQGVSRVAELVGTLGQSGSE